MAKELGKTCIYNFAFVERSGTMKAPVGLLSDGTVLRQQDGGSLPRQVRVCGAKQNNESPTGAFIATQTRTF